LLHVVSCLCTRCDFLALNACECLKYAPVAYLLRPLAGLLFFFA
jgi:hypothetical protein